MSYVKYKKYKMNYHFLCFYAVVIVIISYIKCCKVFRQLQGHLRENKEKTYIKQSITFN